MMPATSAQRLLFVVSVDTEEDDWSPRRQDTGTDNIRELPRLDAFLRTLGVRTTYFTNYAVARDPVAAAHVADVRDAGAAEIAGHLHPWNTPPFDEAFTPRNTMCSNLPASLQAAKLRRVTEAHVTAFGTSPAAFRAGRWGMGPALASALIDTGYRIDSSVTPFHSWIDFDGGPDHRTAPMRAYRIGAGNPCVPTANGALLEIPASFGYSRAPFSPWHRVHERISSPVARPLRLAGIAHRTGLLRKITMSPETDSVADMVSLARRLTESGCPYVHMFWHSPSLKPGLSPFVRDRADVDRLYAAIEAVVERVAGFASPHFVTISEAADLLFAPSPTRTAPSAVLS